MAAQNAYSPMHTITTTAKREVQILVCLLYTSDAADE